MESYYNSKEFLEWKKFESERNAEFGEIPVPHKKPSILQVTILKGRDIDRSSILNIVDKPNPQIMIDYPIADGPTKFTTTRQIDTINPVWNEKFTFILPDDYQANDEVKKAKLKFSLIVEDWHDDNDVIAEEFYNPSDLPIGLEVEKQIDFKRGTVTMRFKKEVKVEPNIRFSMKLSDEEMNFRYKRIPKTMKALQNILGVDDGPKDIFETPVISMACSGGGFRAMVGMCGVAEALTETGLLDCMTYAAGVSGSGWYLSSAYARHAMRDEIKQKMYHDWFKQSVSTSITGEILSVEKMIEFGAVSAQKKKYHQPVTIVDYFGYCMSSETVGSLYSSMKLSDMRPYILEANVPYLILASHQVHDVVDTWSYHAQCNITPFEFELPQYGINIDIKYFNSEFYRGIVNRQNPETTLHYIQGVIGSVFSLRLAKVIRIPCEEEDESDLFDNVSNEVEKLRRKRDSSGFIDSVKSRMVDWFNQLHSFMDRSFFIKRTPEILNFARGHDDIQRFELNPHYIPKEGEDPTTTLEGLSPSEDTTLLVDGGLLVNVPTNPVLRPQRATDILFVFDFAHSGEEISEHWVLQKAVKLARMGGLKFPPIHIDKIKEEPWREFYIFEDADDSECPIVFYFYPCTEKFKRLKTYESSRKNRDKNVTYWEGFTDFDVMDSDTYGMTNSDYSDVDFERLRELMWFNVIINVEVMKRKIKDKILQKRTLKQQQSG